MNYILTYQLKIQFNSILLCQKHAHIIFQSQSILTFEEIYRSECYSSRNTIGKGITKRVDHSRISL